MSNLFNVIFILVLFYLFLLLGKFVILLIMLIQGSIGIDYFASCMDIFNPDTWTNFDVWNFNDISSLILNVLVIFFVCIILAAIIFKWNVFSFRTSKDKYQKENYSSFQNHFERKRAAYRMQYDDNGKITRKTLECFFDWLFLPTVTLQNRLMAEYNRPMYEYWNRQKLHKIPKTAVVESLNVNLNTKENKRWN